MTASATKRVMAHRPPRKNAAAPPVLLKSRAKTVSEWALARCRRRLRTPLTGSLARHRRHFAFLPRPLAAKGISLRSPAIYAGESAATARAPSQPLFPSLATLLAGHVLRDGEVVLLVLKPSLWSIPISVARFAAAVAIFVTAAVVSLEHQFARFYIEAGVFALAGRVMWAMLQWMGRLYILTDARILRLAGVFNIDIFDCPLRKVLSTRVTRSLRERRARVGSIEITPMDETAPPGVWQTIARPEQVHEQIVASVRRAKHGGCGR